MVLRWLNELPMTPLTLERRCMRRSHPQPHFSTFLDEVEELVDVEAIREEDRQS